jgi:hypothetical protein
MANEATSLRYIRNYAAEVAREAILKALSGEWVKAIEMTGQAHLPFFYDSNMLLTYRKPR